MKKQGMLALLIWIIVLAITGYALEGLANTEKVAVLLARTCVAEIGFSGIEDECRLMWSINKDNAMRKGRTIEKQTILFNSYWKSRHQRRLRPWIQYLENEQEPEAWPKKIIWGKYKYKWLAILEAAHAFLQADTTYYYDCKGAVDYGARGETPNMTGGIKPMLCLAGKTRQRYWVMGKRMNVLKKVSK